MRTLHIEDVASHGGPESCVGVPRGRSEALIGGVRAGLLSREISSHFRVPTRSHNAEGNTVGGVTRAAGGPCAVGDPRHARQAPCARTGRSRGRPLVLMMPRPGWVRGVADQRLAGREGNAEAVIP